MKRFSVALAVLFLSISLLPACKGGGGAASLSSAKAITAFSFTSPAATGTINENAKTIAVTLPHGTDVKALVATFTTTGVSVKVNGVDQVSGTTANDFTNPVSYVVTAADSSTAEYAVTVTVLGVISLPKTGQTTTYAAGDDGDLQKGIASPSPRFTDNADGTITDNLTGLMWLKDANCIKTQYSSFDTDGTAGDGMVTWQHALDFVAGINSGTYSSCGVGHADWRLPNRKELRSLVNYGLANSATWLNTQGFTNVQANLYWSSTTYAGDTSRAWRVYMYFGNAYNLDKAGSYYVWPVRSAVDTAPAEQPKTGQTTKYATGDDGDLQKGVAWPSTRFTVVSSGTGTVVTDKLTGLIWASDGGTPTVGSCTGGTAWTWQSALDYVACLNTNSYLGYADWRLPNLNELESLIDVSQVSPALPPSNPFTNVKSSYWSSTTHANDTSLVWYVNMNYGDVNTSDKAVGGFYVWPVRSGP